MGWTVENNVMMVNSCSVTIATYRVDASVAGSPLAVMLKHKHMTSMRSFIICPQVLCTIHNPSHAASQYNAKAPKPAQTIYSVVCRTIPPSVPFCFPCKNSTISVSPSMMNKRKRGEEASIPSSHLPPPIDLVGRIG